MGLLLSTIMTSAVDCLNPIVLTQQFVLQGMVKKTSHIWYFIIPTGLTNLVFGMMVYYGFDALAGSFFKRMMNILGPAFFVAELILGIALLMALVLTLKKAETDSLKKQLNTLKYGESESENADDEENAKRKIKSVAPPALVALGIGTTVSELTTALPYFAFLTILLNYRISFLQLTLILILYNIIYSLPSLILYLIYIRAKDKFDLFYQAIKKLLAKGSAVIAPAFLGIAGVALVCHSVYLMLS